jgi:glycine/D-amino acid oxidase-like deaminating enzyme
MVDMVSGDHGPNYDVAIIGGGAIGLSIAYYLRKAASDCRIAVIERDPSYTLASTPRASGGVRRLFARPENIALSNFSIPVFARFNEEMAVGDEQPDIGFKKNGYLFVVPPKEVTTLAVNYERQTKLGVNLRWYDAAGLKARFPSMNVGDLGAGVESLDDGWLDPYAVLMGLRKKVRSLNVDLVTDEVVVIHQTDRLVRSVDLASGHEMKADIVVNAAGAWSHLICGMVGMPAPITPLRRFEHYFETKDPIERLPYFKDPNRLAFRPEGKGYSGGVPTLNEPRGLNFDVDYGYFDEHVWPALAHRFPQFERTKCKSTMPGLYDQNDFDGNPIIGPWSGGCENFYMAAGFSGHGLMHAPGTGLALSERILTGRYQTLDLTRLGWDRVVRGKPYAEQGII